MISTFLIPSINRPSLDAAIKSLHAQNNSNWNALIVFDGFYCSHHEEKIASVHCIPKIGFGNRAGGVRNCGLSVLSSGNSPIPIGRHIAFLDDDDQIGPYYNALIEEHSDYDIIIFRMISLNGTVRPKLDCTPSYIPRQTECGISFAVRSELLLEKQFRFTPSYNEDFILLNALIESGASHIIPDGCHYLSSHD